MCNFPFIEEPSFTDIKAQANAQKPKPGFIMLILVITIRIPSSRSYRKTTTTTTKKKTDKKGRKKCTTFKKRFKNNALNQMWGALNNF